MHDPKEAFIRFMFFLANCNEGRLQKAICDAPLPVLKPSEVNTMKGIYWVLINGDYVRHSGEGAKPEYAKRDAKPYWEDTVRGSAGETFRRPPRYAEEFEQHQRKAENKLAEEMNRTIRDEFARQFSRRNFTKKHF